MTADITKKSDAEIAARSGYEGLDAAILALKSRLSALRTVKQDMRMNFFGYGRPTDERIDELGLAILTLNQVKEKQIKTMEHRSSRDDDTTVA